MSTDPAFPWGEIFGILACLIASAFFSGAETALTSITSTRARLLMERNPARFGILRLWLNNKRRYITTLLIGNNVVNILCSILGYQLALRFLPNYAEAISVFGVTIIVLIFAEITPKSLALGFSETIAGPALRVVWLIDKLLFPFSWSLSRIPALMQNNVTGREPDDPLPTEDEIEFHIRRGLAESVFEENEQGELLMSAMEFTDTVVREIMIPRTDMIALGQHTTVNDALPLVMESGHSRIPVYDETPDEIVGILYAKDLLAHMVKHRTSLECTQTVVEDIMREGMFFVPETQKIQLLLKDMRRRGLHLAIVVDEFGGTAGLVTLEDILEELVGEIRDEHDRNQQMIQKIADDRYQVNAHMPIYDFEEITGMQLPHSDDYDSVGGMVLALNGRIPRKGKVIDMPPYQVVVVDADERRIKRLEIRDIGTDVAPTAAEKSESR